MTYEIIKDADTSIQYTVVDDVTGLPVAIGGAAITWALLPHIASFSGDIDTLIIASALITKTTASGKVAVTGDGTSGVFTVSLASADTHLLLGEYWSVIRCTVGTTLLPIQRVAVTVKP